MSVGADVKNGLYSVMGAREGCYKTMCTDWDHVVTRDFTWLNKYWDTIKDVNVNDRIIELGTELQNQLNLPISKLALDEKQSEFFKTVYINSDRVIRKNERTR